MNVLTRAVQAEGGGLGALQGTKSFVDIPCSDRGHNSCLLSKSAARVMRAALLSYPGDRFTLPVIGSIIQII